MDVNLLAVAIAALSAFVLGFLWYTIVFAKPWQKLIGMGEGTSGSGSTAQTPNLGKLLILSLLCEIVMAFIFAWLMPADATVLSGLGIGLALGAGLVAASFAVIYLFEGRPLLLWLINGGFYVVVFGVMGVIIGAF